jgi:hypothetical protein
MLMRIAALSAAFFFCVSGAKAEDFRIDFTASNFTDISTQSSIPAPEDLIKGSIVYSAAGEGVQWDSIKSVNLTFDGHRFDLSEIGLYSDEYMVIVSTPIPGGLRAGSGDGFIFESVYADTGYFVYTVPGARTNWISSPVDIKVTALTPIPEPETYGMLLAGLGLITFAARRRAK